MDADAVDDGDPEFEEKDPTGRYGRYNEILGKGAFKTVYRAFDEIEGMEVAWNQVKLRDVMKQSEDLDRLFSEVHLLKTLKHQNIIKFYNSWVDTENDNINFITEIFSSGTLRQYRKKHKHVDMRALKNWSRQILRGLLYLHSHDPPIIHRDLKCDNIFVNGNQGQVKIGDLGLAAILRRTHAAHSVIGTPEFMAPELYEEEYDELVDIYSFGMCLLEMITFEYPYSECANAAQIYKKVTAGIKPAALEKVKDPEVREFVEKCIASASSRLPAKELLRDPFLQNESLNDVRWSYIHDTDYPREQLAAVREEYSSGNSMSPEDAIRLDISRNTNANADDGCEHVDDSLEDETNPWDKLSRDFTVKGQRKHANTVFLTLRMVDSEGYVRNIHFPFDIAFDTATGVAREMVTELDLSDQDVTNIAAMIDAEIQALVPNWEPGEPLDDDDVSVERNAQYDIAALPDDVHQLLKDADPAAEHGSYVLERFPSGRHFWSDSPKLPARPFLRTALMDPSKRVLRPTRSEEIEIHCDFSATDNVKDEQDNSKNYVNSMLAGAEATAPSLVKGTCMVGERRSQSCTEFEKMSDNDNDTETHHEIRNIARHVSAGDHRDNCSSAATTIGMEANLMESLSVVQNADVENMISRNFQRLILRHQEELEGLKRKHKEEIQDFLNDQLKMGFSKGLLRKLLPLTYLVELNEAGNKEIDYHS